MSTSLTPPMGAGAPWLAPLAGYTDLAFRLLCKEYGAAVCCTEMVSAKGLVFGSPGTHSYLATLEADAPVVLQLFGPESKYMLPALDMCLARGFHWFDINAGCPVPKVVKTGCGAALVRTGDSRDRLVRMVRDMAAVLGPGRLGVKYRLGWTTGDDIAVELALRLEEAGAGWLTLHPRHATQGYGGQARWEAIRRVVQAVSIPVMASGDLFQPEDGQRCMTQTGAAGVMFARGALKNPGIFEAFRRLSGQGGNPGGELPHDSPAALAGCIRRHAALAQTHNGSPSQFFRMRGFIPRYVKRLPESGTLRRRLTLCRNWEELETIAAFIATLPAMEPGEGPYDGPGDGPYDGPGAGDEARLDVEYCEKE
ncbi:tRNA dihydrouridine synthase [Megalodesulfovibrio paquesii]